MGYNGGSRDKYDGSGYLLVNASGGAADATTPTEYNVTLASADTEYSQALPTNTLRFTMQNRGYQPLRWSYVTGKVAGPTAPYNQLKPGASISEDDIDLTGKTLYLASSNAGDVVELTVWT